MTSTTAPRHVALIDIGNTRMKIGWLNLTSGQREPVALALEPKNIHRLDAWFKEQNIQPGHAIGVNVAGNDKARTIDTFFLNHFDTSVHWLSSQRQAAGVLNRYTNPAQLGADRWIAMIGLGHIPNAPAAPLLLASFGTATTLDTLCPASLLTSQRSETVITGDLLLDDTIHWIYDGGLIFPGPGLMRASLASNTAQLPEANGNPTAFPTDTHKAIATGIAAAQAGAVVRQWLAGLHRYGVAPRVYGTGGGWPAVESEVRTLLATIQDLQQRSESTIQYLASPILDGLARMAQTIHHPDGLPALSTRP